VDLPCLSTAVFEFVKSDGTSEMRKFKQGSDKDMAAHVLDIEDLAEKVAAAIIKKDAKTKRVAGVDLPSSSFAFVGDSDKTETWKLPISFPGDDEKTKTHIRNALARFEQTKGIPDDKKAEVKAKIDAAASAHGIKHDEAHEKAILDDFHQRLDAAAEAKGLQKGLY
jgi:hypothetical protein